MGGVLALLLLFQQDAAAEAQQHYDRSRQLASQGLFEDAIEELEAAEKLLPSPIIAYELALAYSTVDRCQAAIEAYQRVLRSQPENRVEIQKKIVEQEWRLSHNECKDRPARPPPAAGEPVRRHHALPPSEPEGAPREHYAWGVGARLGLIFGRLGSSQELTGSGARPGDTPIENAEGFHFHLAFQLPIVRADDKRPILQVEPFFVLSYYPFTSVQLVDANGSALAQVTGGNARMPLVGTAIRASIPLAEKWALAPAVGGGVGWQTFALETDHCRLSTSLASAVMSFDLPLRYDSEPHHALYFTPVSLYVIFPPGSDGDNVDATCFGLPSGQATSKAFYELDKTKVNYAFDLGYMYQF